METDLERLRDRCRGAILGTAIGDALGVPIESWHRDDIMKMFKGRPFTGFLNRSKGRRGEKRRDFIHRGGNGTWSDDTQLTVALARSLIRAHGVDWNLMAEEHVRQLAIGPRGWGKSTRAAVLRMMMGTEPLECGTEEGCGNGVVMKLTPVAIYHVLTDQRISLDFSEKLTRMTHDDSRAVVSSHVHMALLTFILKNGYIPENFWETCIQTARRAEGRLPDSEELFSDALVKAQGFVLEGDPEGLWENVPPTCYVCNSLPFTYGMFYLYGRSFERLMTETLYAGGDADSNASMAAAMWGALHGWSKIPASYKKGLEKCGELLMLADLLFDTFVQESLINPSDVRRLHNQWIAPPKPVKVSKVRVEKGEQVALPFISSGESEENAEDIDEPDASIENDPEEDILAAISELERIERGEDEEEFETDDEDEVLELTDLPGMDR